MTACTASSARAPAGMSVSKPAASRSTWRPPWRLLWLLQRPLIESVKWAIVVLLFFSANCFPWYLSWFLPFLAVSPNAAFAALDRPGQSSLITS